MVKSINVNENEEKETVSRKTGDFTVRIKLLREEKQLVRGLMNALGENSSAAECQDVYQMIQ